MQELYGHPACCSGHDFPNLADSEDDASELTKMVGDIWRDKGLKQPTINREVTRQFAQRIWSGVLQGYDAGQVDYDTPDYNMLVALKRQVWHFSAAKNYTQLRQLSAALLDENGKLRERMDFYEQAQRINDTQIRYLRTEYDTAVAGGQMAGKWLEIERNADILPLIRFDATLDTQTTAICRSLDGVTVPITHPIVRIYYPPNHFRCRLTIRQLPAGHRITPDNEISLPTIPTMFRSNLGQSQLIFPKDHPYFIDAPRMIREQGYKLLPYDDQFNSVRHSGDTQLREHILNDRGARDYDSVRQIAEEIARTENVDILPRFDYEDDPVRSILIPDAKPRKYPDLRIAGQLWEVEETGTDARLNTIKNAIRDGSHQANRVIIKLNSEPEERELLRALGSKWKDHKELQEVWFRTPAGEYKKYRRL